ncbi:MAG: hypothetical protein ACRDD8_14155 [Bacteroidales bacterium]
MKIKEVLKQIGKDVLLVYLVMSVLLTTISMIASSSYLEIGILGLQILSLVYFIQLLVALFKKNCK